MAENRTFYSISRRYATSRPPTAAQTITRIVRISAISKRRLVQLREKTDQAAANGFARGETTAGGG